MINDTNEPNEAHKNTPKDEILQEITEKFMEKILDMVNENIQDALKKFQDTKDRDYGNTQKQIKELRGALNKHQTETENTINREINELQMKIKNTKEEVTQDMEKHGQKNQTKKTQWKATPAG
jgi:methyltransferase-like protein